jgi:hypothetical protein
MGQTATSKSASVNQAAKDDYLTSSVTHLGDVVNFSAFLANDPGSAVVKSVAAPFNLLTQTVTIDAAVLAAGYFDYTVQMANGTYSTARVHLLTELLSNGGFDSPAAAGQWQGFPAIPGWTNLNGQSLEIVNSPYGPINSGSPWLDTQASPGGIDISQTVDAATGKHDTLALSLAIQDFGGNVTNASEHLLVLWNGVQVANITTATFDGLGYGHNEFHTFTFDVVGVAGLDTLEVKSVGASNNVGFALDTVSLTQVGG